MKTPTGVTEERWAAYKKDVKAHDAFIARYKLFLERIVNHLEFVRPHEVWTTGEILKVIGNEIKRSDSMDAPNEPGYYRANND